jgi:hypothetical protein
MSGSKELYKYEFPQRPILFQGAIQGYQSRYIRDRQLSAIRLSKEEAEQAFKEELSTRGFNAAHHFAVRRASIKSSDNIVQHHFMVVGYPAIVFKPKPVQSKAEVDAGIEEFAERHRIALGTDHVESRFLQKQERLRKNNLWWGLIAPFVSIVVNFTVLKEPIPYFGWAAGSIAVGSYLNAIRINKQEFDTGSHIDWHWLQSTEAKNQFAQVVDDYSRGET